MGSPTYTPAKPSTSSHRRAATAGASSSACWKRAMSRILGSSPFSWSTPSAMLFDVSIAIACWSPVTIFTTMPCSRAFASVSAVSCRGGSNRLSTPMNCQPPPPPKRPPSRLTATPSERKPRFASASFALITCSRTLSLSAHISSTTVVAPLHTSMRPSGPSSVASVRFVTGSNGVKSTSVYFSSRGPSPFALTAFVMTVSIASAPSMRFAASAP